MQNNQYVPVDMAFPGPGGRRTIWRETLGTICQKNRHKLRSSEGVERFVAAVRQAAEAYSTTPITGDATLDRDDLEALHQIVDMLSLIDE